MSDYKFHFVGGAVVWLAGLLLFWQQFGSAWERVFTFALTSFFICFLGSMLPDTDTPKSKVGGLLQLTVLAAALLFGYSRYFRDWSTPVSSAVNTLVVAGALFAMFLILRPKHRGATHTVRAGLFYGLAVFVLFFLGGSLYEAAFFGIIAFLSDFSHLVLDRQIVF